MGNLLRRSSVVRPEVAKSKWRKGKQKSLQATEISTEGDNTFIPNEKEQKNSNHKQKDWDKRINQQQQVSYINDPPGAPSTYSVNFPLNPNDLMSQSWPVNHEMNNSFYPGNSLPMTTAKSTVLYDPNQYIPNNTFTNQSQSNTQEERPSKKVQFARPIQQQITSNKPLVGTQSWHETSIINSDISTSSGRQEPVLSKPSVSAMKTNTSLAIEPMQKPIYVGIDHRATLAERGQTKAVKRYHKNTDKTNSTSTTNHRSSSHTHHPHKQSESSDSSTPKNAVPSNRSFEPSQGNVSGTHRILTTTSTSTVTPNKPIQQHIEQPVISDNETKRTRSSRQSQNQHIEQLSPTENDTKPARIRGNVSQSKHHHQQPRTLVNRTNSPERSEGIGRMEKKPQTTSMINTSIVPTQQRQKPSTTTNITRTRV